MSIRLTQARFTKIFARHATSVCQEGSRRAAPSRYAHNRQTSTRTRRRDGHTTSAREVLTTLLDCDAASSATSNPTLDGHAGSAVSVVVVGLLVPISLPTPLRSLACRIKALSKDFPQLEEKSARCSRPSGRKNSTAQPSHLHPPSMMTTLWAWHTVLLAFAQVLLWLDAEVDSLMTDHEHIWTGAFAVFVGTSSSTASANPVFGPKASAYRNFFAFLDFSLTVMSVTFNHAS
ncbi:hypothetical protein F5I97DRAFT_56545 [Phlebopus sp. FC_14]|nr:hypothetical protein F5I97DRAFT_56545 [Phlebopus sp. FC_14]